MSKKRFNSDERYPQLLRAYEEKKMMMNRWWVDGWYKCGLYRILNSHSNGTKKGQYVYFASHIDESRPMYIGMTRQGVKNRLWEHIKSKSPIGEAMATIAPAESELLDPKWTCDILMVKGDLEMAERFFIHTYNPVLNIMYFNIPPGHQPVTPLPDPVWVSVKTKEEKHREFMAELESRIVNIYGKTSIEIAKEFS